MSQRRRGARRRPSKGSALSIAEPALFGYLGRCKNILIAGAGGGFDIYAGLPLAHALWRRGQTAHLANLTFTNLALTDAVKLAPALFEVGPETRGADDYFPERSLARFLASEGLPSTVHTFRRVGVRQLFEAYTTLVDKLGIDAIVLVDGGTDILMFGDEAGLGTPLEDMTSLAAVGQVRIAHRHVACLGFGVDAYHGVCHAHVLENIAALDRDGGYHGAFSVSRASEEGALYLRAVEHAAEHHGEHSSIVNGSIAAAIDGQFGNVPVSRRTASSELFINPLMGIYFTFDLMDLCKRNQYVRALVDAPSVLHVQAIIDDHHANVPHRPRRSIPH